MTRISSPNTRITLAGPNDLTDIEELLTEILGPPPANIRDARVMLDLIRRQFALVISLATRDQRALLTVDESEMVTDLVQERMAAYSLARPPRRGGEDARRAISVKQARGMIARAALRLGQDPNSLWLKMIESLLQEDRRLVERITTLARSQAVWPMKALAAPRCWAGAT